MRVAIVSLYTEQAHPSAATKRMRRVSEYIASRGHEVSVFCAQWWEGDILSFTQADVRYVAVTQTQASYEFAVKLPPALSKYRPDVIHVANNPPLQVLAAETGGLFARAPVIIDWWDVYAGKHPWIRQRAARLATHHIVPSEMVEVNVRRLGIENNVVTRIPEPIYLDKIERASVEDTAHIVFINQLDAHANIDSFLLGLAGLRNKRWRAAVIGTGLQRAQAMQTAQNLRIFDRTKFVDTLEPERFVPILKGARVFVQTAAREPFARYLLWALSCGCVGVVEYQARSSAHELAEKHDRGVPITQSQQIASAIAGVAKREHKTIDRTFADYDVGSINEQFESLFQRLGATDRGDEDIHR